jgi:hypothetical protein
MKIAINESCLEREGIRKSQESFAGQRGNSPVRRGKIKLSMHKGALGELVYRSVAAWQCS